jgi:hypothetical protein
MRRLIILTALALLALPAAAFAAPKVVLGQSGFEGANGRGWGTAHPYRLSNGGDLNGNIFKIHWYSWGGATASGVGENFTFKPHGGYYTKPVVARLHATDLGRCYDGGPLTYRKLYFRVQVRPGGPFSRTYSWTGPSTLCTPY